jgi:drug/metabolite transporter (DMT)-like permease
MLYLVLSILCSAAVVHLLKLAGKRTDARFAVFAVNYLVAGGLGLAVSGLSGAAGEPPVAWALAVALGALYVAGFIVFSRAIPHSGAAVAASASRISVAVPIAAAVVLFNEPIAPVQTGAVILAVLALPLGGPEPPWRHRDPERHAIETKRPNNRLVAGFVWPALLFLIIGVSDVALKVRVELLPASDPGWFFGAMFLTAFLICLGAAIVSRRRVTWSTVWIGAVLGAVNFGTAFFLSGALEQLSGFRVYTINSVGIILVVAATGVLLWNERPKVHNYVFLGMSLVSIILLST